METLSIAKWIMALGAGIFLTGAICFIAVTLGVPVGSLPGDFHKEGGNYRIYIPLTTCILISIVLTIALNVLGRFFGSK